MNKAVFFDQMRRGKISGRHLDAQSETALSYGQVRAAATGDELLLEHAEVEILLARLQRLAAMHGRSRHRDAQEAVFARKKAEEHLAYATLLRRLLDQVKQGQEPGFTTLRNERLETRSEIGASIAGQVLTLLLNRTRTWKPAGNWSGVPLYLGVAGDQLNFRVELLFGEHWQEWGARVGLDQLWISGEQQWRIAAAIEAFFEKAPGRIENARVAAEKQYADAEHFDLQAQQPFAHTEELRGRLARKLALDAYTAAIAAGRDAEEIAAMRESLLKDAPQDGSLLPVDEQLLALIGEPVSVVPDSLAPALVTATVVTPGALSTNDERLAPLSLPHLQVEGEEQGDVATPEVLFVPSVALSQPIRAEAGIDEWASLRAQYGVGGRKKRGGKR